MILLDTITLWLGTAALIIAVVTALVNPFMRRKFLKRASFAEDGVTASPSLSVIIAVHDEAEMLDKVLPSFLQQQYPAPFQIIIVYDEGDSETEDVLKRYASDPHLYYTFIPDSSRYMSRKKLAITLGVKAAKYEWIVLTDIDCQPTSTEWLSRMARHCKEGVNLVLGYSNYDADSKPYYRFEQLLKGFYLLRKAAKGIAFRTNMRNLMFRKSEFMAADGFRGNLQLARGEYDFIVNKYARRGATAIELSPEARLVEVRSWKKLWVNRHLYALASRPFLQRRHSIQGLAALDQVTLHAGLLFLLAVLAYSLVTCHYVLTAIAAVSLLLCYILRAIIDHRAIRYFDDSLHAALLPLYELSQVWHMLLNHIRYHRADKKDFTSHKL